MLFISHQIYCTAAKTKTDVWCRMSHTQSTRVSRLPDVTVSVYLDRPCCVLATGQSARRMRACDQWQRAAMTPRVNLSFSFVSRIVVSAVFRLVDNILSSGLYCWTDFSLIYLQTRFVGKLKPCHRDSISTRLLLCFLDVKACLLFTIPHYLWKL